MNELNSLSCELSGLNLIEAAAGTGKTYNIQNLVVRLLLDRAVLRVELDHLVDEVQLGVLTFLFDIFPDNVGVFT